MSARSTRFACPRCHGDENSGRNYQHCGHHSENGCAFDCPNPAPPTDPARYRSWADDRIFQYAMKGARK